MSRRGIAGLPYCLNVHSLEDIASRRDRVCVLNILGGESRQVTPVCHSFSGGNVVFGTSPGRGGQRLKTAAGDIPVFNNVREGLDAGLAFNTGVVYLPPSAVRDGVAELIRVNAGLEKIVIITEKIPVHDAREIRALGQSAGVDIFGGNCLGMADSWNRVRIGGALGGDDPREVLLKGSVAIFSNSGGFTTTIAQYLATHGWGTTTLVSSGKDIYIHYSVRDFALAFANDARSQAAVLYSEPGGYYEQDLAFDKPVVACVVGRWKSRLTRAVGHAGAIAGAGDDALGVPFSLILAVVLLGERIAWRRLVALICTFGGVVLLLFDPAIVDEVPGLLLSVLGALLWAIGSLQQRRLVGVPVLTIYAWVGFVGAAVMVPLALLIEPATVAALPHTPPLAFAAIVFSALGSTVLGQGGMAWLLQRHPVATVTPLILAVPLIAVLAARLIFGTPLTPPMLLGGMIVMTGVVIISLRSARRPQVAR